MDLAAKDMRRHVGKFIATSVGVGLLLTIVLVMNGIYQGNIADGVWLIDNTATDLWVVERGRGGPFNEASRMPGDTWRSVAASPGVAQASPFIVYTAQRDIGGASRQFTIVGYDVVDGLGAPGRIVRGRRIAAPHYEMVADEKLGLALDDRVRLGSHDYRVVGLTRAAVDAAGNPLLYLALPDAQDVLYQQDNEALRAARTASQRRLERAGLSSDQATRLLPVIAPSTDTINAVLVRLVPGTDVDRVRQHITDWLYLNVYTTDEERELMLSGRLRMMSAVLGLFRSLLVVVSIVIIALIIYVLTMEKIRPIATLKLIGASNWVIVRMIIEQSLVLTMLSFVFAWGLVQFVKEHFPRTLVILPEETALTFLVMLVGGMVASLMAIWHALRTPPSLALGG